jgi:hypothetical protein
MTFRNCLPPFEGRYSRGPYFYERWGRFRIDLLSPQGRGHCKAITYARYLLSIKLGRELQEGMEVDHIDGDRTNDLFSNLQELSREENSKKRLSDQRHLSTFRLVEFRCPHCKKVFTRRRGQSHLVKGGFATYCSRPCSRHFKEYLTNFTQEYREIPPLEIATLKVCEDWVLLSYERVP